jgi:hypothetical protein
MEYFYECLSCRRAIRETFRHPEERWELKVWRHNIGRALCLECSLRILWERLNAKSEENFVGWQPAVGRGDSLC